MINSFLATRPTSDRTTKFISAWAEEVVKLANSKCSKVFDLHKQKANKKELESYLRKHHPELVFLNGHGSESAVAGQDNEILIEAGVNKKILKGSIVYALSCKSGKILGKQSVLSGAQAYVGYEEDFIFLFQQQNRARPLEDKTAELFFKPSNQVVISLLKGHTAQESYSSSKRAYLKNIQKLLTSQTSLEQSSALRYLIWDMKHLVCHQ